MPLEDDIITHYTAADEAGRLSIGVSQLERERTRELILRDLGPPPQTVLDIGGGPGDYAFWLAERGHAVHLLDLVPKHIEQAKARSARNPHSPLASCIEGDARDRHFEPGSADCVLFLGPMYHILEREGRIRALKEAARALKPGAVLFAAMISRYASLLDGLFRGFIRDPEFAPILERDLRDGIHQNPTGKQEYFTDAFFHRAEDVEAEISDAGLELKELFAVEGPAWLLQDFGEWWEDPDRRKTLLKTVREIESDRSLLSVSAHILAVARPPA